MRPITFGGALRAIRLAAGDTQAQFASRIGVDFTYVSHLEADRKAPSLTLLRNVVTAYRLRDPHMKMLLAAVRSHIDHA